MNDEMPKKKADVKITSGNAGHNKPEINTLVPISSVVVASSYLASKN